MADDGEGNQTADGSWQPDPTGRYRLRWQRSSGEWTDHVYSSEGELGSDPYDTSPPPPPSQPEPPQAATPSEGGQPTDSPRKPRSRGKKVLIVLGVIVALVIVVGIVGSLVEPDSGTTSGGSALPRETTPAPTPTQATTPPAEETDCARKIGRATTLATQWIAEAEMAMTGDYNSATLAYDVAMLTYDDMQEASLDAYACNLEREWFDEAERWADIATEAQNIKAELHYTCSTEFAPRGFECPPGE